MRINPSVMSAIALFGWLYPCSAQQDQGSQGPTTHVIDLDRGAPIRDAIDVLRQRYNLSITYEGPVYACPCDLTDVSYLQEKPGQKLFVPTRRHLHFEYAEIGGKPMNDTATLLRRLVSEYADQGGEVFDVRERTTTTGIQWNVVPLKAHGASGEVVDQPDILGASIAIAESQRSQAEFLSEMLAQLTAQSGYRVALGTVETRLDWGVGNLGAKNVPARDVLANLFGTDMVWDLNYDTEYKKYVLNLVRTPRPPQPLTSYTLPPDVARTPSMRPGYIPPGAALRQMLPPQRVTALQLNLAQGGYYAGQPTGKIDANTVDALKKFQAANNLPVTGRLDPETIHKLGLDTNTSQH